MKKTSDYAQPFFNEKLISPDYKYLRLGLKVNYKIFTPKAMKAMILEEIPNASKT